MRRVFFPGLVLGCLAWLVLACFGRVLLDEEQLAYRDAAQFYYPLYQRVQQEWRAGRVPLWESEENAGMPLAGNPAAAVFYPGKVVYACLPYAWAARVYVVFHVVLACAGQWALLRHWDVRPAGAAIGGLAYAFGGPVLFQYCNVIFLVGAAWAPWGLLAADRLLRDGRRCALVELAGVLALQFLGGDPEAAYLTALSAAAYNFWLSRAARDRPRARIVRRLLFLGSLALCWIAVLLASAHLILEHPAARPLAAAVARAIRATALAAWLLVAIVLGRRWWRRSRAPRGQGVLAVAAAALLPVLLAALVVLPAAEFLAQTNRVDDAGQHDVYPFSVEPCRVLELAWPNVFGTMIGQNRFWLPLVPPKHSTAFWTPSLYLGAITLVLALHAVAFRRAPPWRGWMTALALVSFLGALGEYGSPLWWGRTLPGAEAYLGRHDLRDWVNPPRPDGSLQDGDGGFYSVLTKALPGFRVFRYPGKLLTFTALALAALAGLGWNDSPRASDRDVPWHGRADCSRRLWCSSLPSL
jgi:hypothetical protein